MYRVVSCEYDYLRTGGLVNRFFEYFASMNVKSFRIGIVMESSCQVLSKNVISS